MARTRVVTTVGLTKEWLENWGRGLVDKYGFQTAFDVLQRTYEDGNLTEDEADIVLTAMMRYAF